MRCLAGDRWTQVSFAKNLALWMSPGRLSPGNTFILGLLVTLKGDVHLNDTHSLSSHLTENTRKSSQCVPW